MIPAAQQQQIAAKMETDAEVMSNTQLRQQISTEPQDVQDAILAINTEARNRSLQFALLVPALPDFLVSPTRFGCDAFRTSNPRHLSTASVSGSSQQIGLKKIRIQGVGFDRVGGPSRANPDWRLPALGHGEIGGRRPPRCESCNTALSNSIREFLLRAWQSCLLQYGTTGYPDGQVPLVNRTARHHCGCGQHDPT